MTVELRPSRARIRDRGGHVITLPEGIQVWDGYEAECRVAMVQPTLEEGGWPVELRGRWVALCHACGEVERESYATPSEAVEVWCSDHRPVCPEMVS